VTVVDGRLAWFRAHVTHGLEFMLANGLDIRYFGGHLPVTVIPSLPAPNPDLTIFMRGEQRRAGVLVATFPTAPAPPVPFDPGASQAILGKTILAPTPVPAAPEAAELRIEFVASQAPAAPVVHTIVRRSRSGRRRRCPAATRR